MTTPEHGPEEVQQAQALYDAAADRAAAAAGRESPEMARAASKTLRPPTSTGLR
jgi:hypothetical protein